jgi:hypothetical protein
MPCGSVKIHLPGTMLQGGFDFSEVPDPIFVKVKRNLLK